MVREASPAMVVNMRRMNADKNKPTGIAAANVEVEGTDVCAVTIHSLFDLDGDTYNTKLDFAKKSHKVQVLVGLDCPGEIVPCAWERARAR